MKIFIAGGAGFIGSHVTDQLLKLGHKVMVFDNFSSGRRENLTDRENLEIYEGNIINSYELRDIADYFNPDIIIHAANEPVKQLNECNEIGTNILGTMNLINIAKYFNVKRFIYFQTVLIYGNINTDEPLKTDQPVNPLCSYAISKLAAERYIRNSGLDFISFRLANHYGPRNMTGAFPVFYKKLKAGDRCQISDERRTFVYVSDLVELVVKACNYEKYPSGIYHVSTHEDYSIKDIFLKVYKAVKGHEYDESSNEHEFVTASEKAMKVMRLDWSETMKTFDWVPVVPLSRGIENAVKWYEKYGVEKTFTHFQR